MIIVKSQNKEALFKLDNFRIEYTPSTNEYGICSDGKYGFFYVAFYKKREDAKFVFDLMCNFISGSLDNYKSISKLIQNNIFIMPKENEVNDYRK